ncbi:hypothetical protein [Glutamicibacter arilaitensis]|uniref:hypothetical protein n=1 Tax=Glutamicibacter arilaitensis TaxID=256701 RepID=UPI003FD1F789
MLIQEATGSELPALDSVFDGGDKLDAAVAKLGALEAAMAAAAEELTPVLVAQPRLSFGSFQADSPGKSSRESAGGENLRPYRRACRYGCHILHRTFPPSV